MATDNIWVPIKGDELQSMLELINPVQGKYVLSPKVCTAARYVLPFYDNVDLIEIQRSKHWPFNERFNYLTLAGRVFHLNGTSAPVHAVNAEAPVRITAENVAKYITFFCSFIRGDKGPFVVLDGASGKAMAEGLAEPMRSRVEEALRPIVYKGRVNCLHQLEAVVLYANALFRAVFAVHPNGNVFMLEDEPLVEDIFPDDG